MYYKFKTAVYENKKSSRYGYLLDLIVFIIVFIIPRLIIIASDLNDISKIMQFLTIQHTLIAKKCLRPYLKKDITEKYSIQQNFGDSAIKFLANFKLLLAIYIHISNF